MEPKVVSVGRQRSLHSISTSDGLVLLLDPDGDRAALELVGGHISAVRFRSVGAAVDAIESEALPGSVGFVCDLSAASPAEVSALGAAGAVISWDASSSNVSSLESNDGGASWLSDQVATLHSLGLAALVDLGTGPSTTEADRRGLDEVVEALGQVGEAGADLVLIDFPLSADVDDAEQWTEACQRIDDSCPAPWVVGTADAPFALGLRQVRASALAGGSGCVLGHKVWRGEGGPHATDAPGPDAPGPDAPGPDALANALRLIAAQRRGVAAWDALSTEVAPETGPLRWFGVRTFVVHSDVDRLEERVVIHRAATGDEALSLGQAEADEYAQAFAADAVDAAQVYEIALADVVDAASGGFVSGAEVYSQLRPIRGDVDAVLEPYFD